MAEKRWQDWVNLILCVWLFFAAWAMFRDKDFEKYWHDSHSV